MENSARLEESPRKKIKLAQTRGLDVMIDIETLSTNYDAALLSIAAVKFNPFDKTEALYEEFQLFVDIEDCKDKGCTISEDTMTWWQTQPEEVRKINFESQPRLSLTEALSQLSSFCRGVKRYWCQGMNFDPIVLENAYKIVGLKPEWKFWEWRDSRTISRLIHFTNIPKKPKNAHDAIEDCKYQIQVVQTVFDKLNIKHA